MRQSCRPIGTNRNEHIGGSPDHVNHQIFKPCFQKKNSIRNILIIKPSSLGDIVHSLPVAKAVRQIFPDASIVWLVKDEWSEILKGNPYIDEIISFPFSFKKIARLIGILRKKRFDLVVDIQCLFRSGLIGYLAGVPIRIGFENGRELSHIFYNIKVKVPDMDIHAVDRYMLVPAELEKVIGKSSGYNTDSKDFTMITSIEDEEYIEKFFNDNNIGNNSIIAAISPSARWHTKMWLTERFAEVADILNKKGVITILVGSRSDRPLIDKITSLMSTNPVIAAGKTNLKQLISLLKRTDIMITNDSGPMHIAAAIGTPIVAIFGPTDPVRTGPYGNSHVVIRRNDIDCLPCLKRKCYNNILCMNLITVDEVTEEAIKMLKHSKPNLKGGL